jgi:hypothetical protein
MRPRLGGERGDRRVTRTTWIVLGLCSLLIGGCLGHRLTAAEVVRHTQAALGGMGACHSILDLEIDTDLLKDSISLELWEQNPDRLKVRVLSAVNAQLRGLVFSTDGRQSVSYSPHTNQALIGPADRVKMPLLIERLIQARVEWIQGADPEKARIIARERDGGLVVYRIRIPLSQDGYAEYGIDARQWWVRRITYEDGYLGAGVVYVRLLECFAELDTAQFDLDIPDGVPISKVAMEDNRPLTIKEAQMAVPFPLRTPGYLPEGTRFSVAYQLDKNVAMVYTGERSFTLVQGPSIGQVPQERATPIPLRGRQATVISDVEHDGLVLTWREDGLQFSIAASLDQEEVVRIAESLQLAFKSPDVGQDGERTSDQGR